MRPLASMQPLASADEYRALVKDNKRRLGTVRTNCMLMPRAFAEPAADGRLAFATYDDGLLVRTDEGAYATLYYYWREGAPMVRLHDNVPLYVEETREPCDEHAAFLRDAGLVLQKRNVQYVLARDDWDSRTDDRADGYAMARCEDEALAAEVVALWGRRLGLADIPLAHKEFLSRGDAVWCALSPSGELAGAIWWQDAGKTRLMRHIVVDERHTRRGLAKTLLALCATDACQTGMLKVSTWISDANYASIALHEGMGFCATTRVVLQFVAEEE